MTKAYYFIFTSGDHYEFNVQGVAISDKKIDPQLWRDHLFAYGQQLSARGWSVQGYRSWEEWYDAGGYAKLERWKARNEPHKTFMRQHGMRLLAVTDLHADS